jgi:hypothetical protein
MAAAPIAASVAATAHIELKRQDSERTQRHGLVDTELLRRVSVVRCCQSNPMFTNHIQMAVAIDRRTTLYCAAAGGKMPEEDFRTDSWLLWGIYQSERGQVLEGRRQGNASIRGG